MSMKPKLFVASSREAKAVADAVQHSLEDDAIVTVWDDDAIHLGESVIDGLIRNCQESQFGVFVIAPDDKATIRDEVLDIVRDNVLLELGMFIGRIGKERSFIIRPRWPDRSDQNLRLPSDLAGVNIGYYDATRPPDQLKSAVNSVCRQIANAIKRQTTSQLSRQEELLNSLVKLSLETVCRAMGVPSTPEQASLRLFIFRKEGDELVCRHYWDPNPSDEAVGTTRFRINEDKDAIVVKCYEENRAQRSKSADYDDAGSHCSEIAGKAITEAGTKIKPDLVFIRAAPIHDKDGSIWGVVDFDTSNETGKALLQTDLAGTVMVSMVRQLRFMLLQS